MNKGRIFNMMKKVIITVVICSHKTKITKASTPNDVRLKLATIINILRYRTRTFT